MRFKTSALHPIPNPLTMLVDILQELGDFNHQDLITYVARMGDRVCAPLIVPWLW